MSNVLGFQLARTAREAMFEQLSKLIRDELSWDSEGSIASGTPQPAMRTCPSCGSCFIRKRGHDAKGRQRYLCKGCNKSSTVQTSSNLASTKLPLSVWLVFARCHVEKRSIRQSAEICKVSSKTALAMRHRIIKLIQASSAQAQISALVGYARSSNLASPRDTSAAAPSIRIIAGSPGECGKSYQVNGMTCLNSKDCLHTMAKTLVNTVVAKCNKAPQRASDIPSSPAFKRFVSQFRGISQKHRSGYQWWHAWAAYTRVVLAARLLASETIKRIDSVVARKKPVDISIPTQAFAQSAIAHLVN